jgi:hypothetical protein
VMTAIPGILFLKELVSNDVRTTPTGTSLQQLQLRALDRSG